MPSRAEVDEQKVMTIDVAKKLRESEAKRLENDVKYRAHLDEDIRAEIAFKKSLDAGDKLI